MKLSKKIWVVPLLSLPLIFNSICNEKRRDKIKREQERLFEKTFDTKLNIKGYCTKDLGRIKMMVPRKADSVYIDDDLTPEQEKKTLPHEYAHIIQNNIIRKLKKEGIYKSAYDTSKVYSLITIEGSAEAAKNLVLNKKMKTEKSFEPFENKKTAWLFYGLCPKDFYTKAANFVYPLMKKQGLEKTLVGVFTTDPPTSSDFWNEEKRKNYIEKIEKNSEKYSPIILDK